MDELVKNLISSAPGTGAAIAVVLIFINYIRSRDKSYQDLVQDFRDTSKHCSLVIEDNSNKMGENSAALRDTTEVNRQMLTWLMKHNGNEKQ